MTRTSLTERRQNLLALFIAAPAAFGVIFASLGLAGFVA